jgi:hypothetical protein
MGGDRKRTAADKAKIVVAFIGSTRTVASSKVVG